MRYAWCRYYCCHGQQVNLQSGAVEAGSLAEAEQIAAGLVPPALMHGRRIDGRLSFTDPITGDVSYLHVRDAAAPG